MVFFSYTGLYPVLSRVADKYGGRLESPVEEVVEQRVERVVRW